MEKVEAWKDIPGYGGKYQASYDGRVRRVYGKSGKTRMLTPYHRKMSGSQRLVTKLTKDGKSREVVLMQVVALAFLGPCPAGCVPYHKNGLQSDNWASNLVYISKQELGRLTGPSSRRKPVAKLDCSGEAVEVYSSAREAGRKNYCSYQTVIDRCNGKVKKPLGDIDFAWDDSGVSMGRARERLIGGAEPHRGAPEVAFDW